MKDEKTAELCLKCESLCKMIVNKGCQLTYCPKFRRKDAGKNIRDTKTSN